VHRLACLVIRPRRVVRLAARRIALASRAGPGAAPRAKAQVELLLDSGSGAKRNKRVNVVAVANAHLVLHRVRTWGGARDGAGRKRMPGGRAEYEAWRASRRKLVGSSTTKKRKT
jgi:hypothetical protein